MSKQNNSTKVLTIEEQLVEAVSSSFKDNVNSYIADEFEMDAYNGRCSNLQQTIYNVSDFIQEELEEELRGEVCDLSGINFDKLAEVLVNKYVEAE